MEFRINPQIFEKFPGMNVGVVIVKNADNSGENSEISKLLRSEEKRIKNAFQPETLSQDPKIACWRVAYSSFGVKSKEAKSSVENLYKMVARGLEIRKINKLVDLYNFICLKYMVPVGGEDTDKIVGDLTLAIAGEDEKQVQLLGDIEPEQPREGEVLYKDDDSAVCRRFNWREADRTKLTAQTKNCILVVEGLPPTTRSEIESAVSELKDLVEKYCLTQAKTAILDKENSSIEI